MSRAQLIELTGMALSHLILSLNILNPNISYSENSVDPDQLASKKPADLEPHFFPLCLLMHAYDWNSLRLLD